MPLIFGCGGGGGGSNQSGSAEAGLNIPEGFPDPIIPQDNYPTSEKINLGRHLFYDKRLSGNGTQSCGSCHIQALGFATNTKLAVGSTGQTHPRNSNSLVNAAYNSTYTWSNPNLLTIERQMLVPMFGQTPVELGIAGNEQEVLGRFKSDSDYSLMFNAAFPEDTEPVSFDNIVKSTASFVRSLNSGNSAYDKYTRGDESGFSASAKRGLDLFFSERLECHHCHDGINFTLSTSHAGNQSTGRPFHNTGLYNVGGTGNYPGNNQGIYEFTNDPADRGKFRAPSLRNVEVTAPYMHDGSISSLEEVVDFYAAGGRNITSGPNKGDGRKNPNKSGFITGFTLSGSEKEDLISFLRSLTDQEFLQNPALSNPFPK